MNLSGKSVAVLGAGGSGFAAASLALHCGASVAAFDSGDPEKLRQAGEKFAEKGITLTCGEEALTPPSSFDLTVISPGIDAATPIGLAFSDASDELVGEVEFANRLSSVPVIAITGTNGKTTTTSLIDHLLNGSGLKSVAAGNIGKAYSEVVLEGEELDWVVLEVSSFQLETIVDFAPKIAVWMNFAPDHMDRYTTLEDYRAAKLRLFERVDEETLVISKWEEGFEFSNHATFSAFSKEGRFTYDEGGILDQGSGSKFDYESGRLHGKHNAENVMVALAVADYLGLPAESVAERIRQFEAPRHRCEKVG
ncbi:MAG: UDP-N-acetylmuramoyl-L-alanine--D-glutamate ligase [Verrucomicrobiota bacterium]